MCMDSEFVNRNNENVVHYQTGPEIKVSKEIYLLFYALGLIGNDITFDIVFIDDTRPFHGIIGILNIYFCIIFWLLIYIFILLKHLYYIFGMWFFHQVMLIL